MATQDKGINNVFSGNDERTDRENDRSRIDSGSNQQQSIFGGYENQSEKRSTNEDTLSVREMGVRTSSTNEKLNEDGRNSEKTENDVRRTSDDRGNLFASTRSTENEIPGVNGRRGAESINTRYESADLVDFEFREEFKVGSVRKKYEKNIAALELILTENPETLDQEQKEIIAHYSGWGGVPQAFDSRNDDWSEEYNKLKGMLTDDDYSAARSSVIDSFYTPLTIRKAMWNGLQRLGLNNDETEKLILEPAVGTGNFLANKPGKNFKFTTIELDNISHKIVSALYPNQTHFHRGFESVQFAPEFDAVISNPPFSSQRVPDNNENLNGLSLHNYFIAKSQGVLADKGVSAFVVSSTFMDGKDDRTRLLVDKDSTFLGAVRLPNNSFSNAHTQVMTDIVFFQKGKHLENEINHDWLNIVSQEDDSKNKFTINEYFANNPQNVLGSLAVRSGRFGQTLVCLKSADQDLDKDLEDFINSLPRNIYKKESLNLEQPDNESIIRIKLEEDHAIHQVRDNQFFLHEDEIYYRTNVEQTTQGEVVCGIKHVTSNNSEPPRIKHFIAIRDKVNELYEIQKSQTASEAEVDKIRNELNELYDKRIANNKDLRVLNRRTFVNACLKDSDLGKVLALEKNIIDEIDKKQATILGVDPRPLSAEKADIFFRRTIRKEQEIIISSTEDALIASYNEFGKPNLSWIADKLNIGLDKVKEELISKDLIFIDHITGEAVTPEHYLSGNVVKKLEEAKEKAFDNPSFRKNINALQKVQPERIKASDIGVDISSSWVPKKHIDEYFQKLLETDNFKIYKDEGFGNYDIDLSSSALSYHVRKRVETKKCNADRLISSLLSNSPVKITKMALDENNQPVLTDKGNPTRESDEDAIAEVRTIQTAIKRDFQDWIWKDPARRNDIEDAYNSIFNTNVPPKYNGAHLSLDSLNPKYELRKHQKDAVWRMLQEGGGILDHVVGAGKTLAAIAIAVESKRMGLHTKPMVTVPNHLVYQWRDSIYDAYPQANVLVPTAEDMSAQGREKFYGKIASNDWDLVIMPHSQFQLLPSPPEMEKEVIQKEIDSIMRTIDNAENGRSKSVKNLQRRVDSRTESLNKLLTRHNQSEAMNFADLGVDALIVDEAHEFKNLSFITEKDGVLGLGKADGSKKAEDLFTKVRWLQKNNNNRGVYFLTGTPISNTIAEMYTMQRYLQFDTLEEKGIHRFDAWASSFGEIGHTWELDSSGTRYKLVSRFNKFKNVPELLSLYGQCADVVDNNEIAKFNGSLIPKSRGGKPLNIVVPRTEEVAEYIGTQDPITGEYTEGSVIWRMDNSQLDKRMNNMLKCTNDARRAGLDYRLIDPDVPESPLSKLNAVADHVFKEYVLFDEHKGTQLVFCDMSVAKKKSQSINLNEYMQTAEDDLSVNLEELSEEELNKLSDDDKLALTTKFDAYSDLLKKLVDKGIPQNEIRFIHDCDKDEQRAKLFKDVNEGKVRVLIGSTSKMGAGMNVQKRLTAMHHVDCPWRPSDIEQRNGRGYRQGNIFHNDPEKFPNFGVLEVRYSTQNTYDARMWEINEQKALSIEQLKIAGKNSSREMGDVSSASSNAAEMKAAATGNPLMQMQQEIKQLLKTQEAQYSHFLRQEHEQQDIYNHLKNLKYPYVKRDSYLAMINERLPKDIVDEQEVNKYVVDSEIVVLNPKDKHISEIRQDFHKDIKAKIENLQDEGVQIEILQHRGLSLMLDKTITPVSLQKDEVNYNFEVVDKNGNSFSPRNLSIIGVEINGQTDISISGLMTRFNNAVDGIDVALDLALKEIEDRELKLAFYEKRKVGVYEDMDLLHALRKDDEDILRVIRNQTKDEETALAYVPSYKLLDPNISKEEVLESRKNEIKVYFPEIARRFELVENIADNYYVVGDRKLLDVSADLPVVEIEHDQVDGKDQDIDSPVMDIEPEFDDLKLDLFVDELFNSLNNEKLAYIHAGEFFDNYCKSNLLINTEPFFSELLMQLDSNGYQTPSVFDLMEYDEKYTKLENISNEALYLRLKSFEIESFEKKSLQVSLLEYTYANKLTKEIESRESFYTDLKFDEQASTILNSLHNYRINSYKMANNYETKELDTSVEYPLSILESVDELNKIVENIKNQEWTYKYKDSFERLDSLSVSIEKAAPFTNLVKVEKMLDLSQQLMGSPLVKLREEERFNFQATTLSNYLKSVCDEVAHIYQTTSMKFDETITMDEVSENLNFMQSMDLKFEMHLNVINEFVNGNVIDFTDKNKNSDVLKPLYEMHQEIIDNLGGGEYLNSKEKIIMEQQSKVERMLTIDRDLQKDFYFINNLTEKAIYLSENKESLNNSTVNRNHWISIQQKNLLLVENHLIESSNLSQKVCDDNAINQALLKNLGEKQKDNNVLNKKIEKGVEKLRYWADDNKQALILIENSLVALDDLVCDRGILESKLIHIEDIRLSALKKPDDVNLIDSLKDIQKSLLIEKDIEDLNVYDLWKDTTDITVDENLELKQKLSKLINPESVNKFIECMDNKIPENIGILSEEKREELQRNALIGFYKENNLTQENNENLTLSYIEYTKHKHGKGDRISIPRLMQYDKNHFLENLNVAKKDIENYYNEIFVNKNNNHNMEAPHITKSKLLYKKYENLFQNFKALKLEEKTLSQKSNTPERKEEMEIKKSSKRSLR